MRRRAALAATGLLGLLAVLELGTGWYGERSASEALCGADVDLATPVLLRVLAGRAVPFEARFDERVLELLVPLPAAVSGIAVEDGRLRLETTTGVTVPTDVRLEAGTVTLTPTLGPVELDRLALRYELVDLLPTGVEVDRVEVSGDAVLAAGRGDPREFTATGRALDCVS
ncbi:MAG: hypothetical protein KY461_00735 [Actinobacteria bacterium]|nr:hypothetical protein [Actinomycetota bacterium]